jgi:hypothetical protein
MTISNQTAKTMPTDGSHEYPRHKLNLGIILRHHSSRRLIRRVPVRCLRPVYNPGGSQPSLTGVHYHGSLAGGDTYCRRTPPVNRCKQSEQQLARPRQKVGGSLAEKYFLEKVYEKKPGELASGMDVAKVHIHPQPHNQLAEEFGLDDAAEV